jgi:restriction system protein
VSRRRQSNLEALIDLAALLPWWVAMILAALSYVALHAVSQTPISAPSRMEGLSGTVASSYINGLATVGQYILPLVFFFGAGLSAAKAYRNRRLLTEAKQTAGASTLLNLSWQDFERLVGQAFRERGFAVRETNDGPDGGVDLELRKNSELQLVQCKRWRARKVGVEIVRELYGVMSARGATGGYVVSSGEFSDEARHFAAGRNIDLWDGAKLTAVIRGIQERPRASNTTGPVCPTCGAPMVKRVAKRGANSGQSFWGCSRYPECRGTRAIPSAPL